jgi:hypothetical protein
MVEDEGITIEVVEVELVQNGTFRSRSCRPSDNMIAPVAAPKSSIKAYMMRLDVELRHDGHAVHKQDAAVEVQQQAS